MGTNTYVHGHLVNCGVIFEGNGEETAEKECVKHLEEATDNSQRTVFLEVGVLAHLEKTGPSGCNTHEIFRHGKVPSRCPEKIDDPVEYIASSSFASCIESIHESRKPVLFSNRHTGDQLKLWVEKDQLWAWDNCGRGRRRLLQAVVVLGKDTHE